VFKSKRKKELLAEIEEGFSDKEVYISRIVGMDILLALLEHGSSLKTIVVPPSVYAQTSDRVRSYLKEARVSLEKGEDTAGRPPKYTKKDIKEIVKLKEGGIPIVEISRKLDIPRRTIYYLLKEK